MRYKPKLTYAALTHLPRADVTSPIHQPALKDPNWF
jgi:hypothetical protein